MVFAGYGITDAAHHYDDYAGLDVKGKVVLVIRYEPKTSEGKSRLTKDGSWSAAATFASKCRAASEHGAAAVLYVNPPAHDKVDSLSAFWSGPPGDHPTLPVVQIKEDLALSMVKAGGAGDLKGLEEEIDKDLKPQSGALKDVTASGSVVLRKAVRNVVAYLPGNGDHADEYVVIGAHYDHLGHGGPGSLAPWSHAIHPGADDNASGTTAMLAIADDLAHSPPLERSLIFIAFTAEEEGLIGSQHFVEHCPVPLNKIAYMVNLDMVGRVQRCGDGDRRDGHRRRAEKDCSKDRQRRAATETGDISRRRQGRHGAERSHVVRHEENPRAFFLQRDA